jgi:predicted DNA-binding transcriptional regulator AlpA
MDTQDRVLTRAELMAAINVTTTETIRRKLKAKLIPPPDVKLSQRIVGWRVSTLRAAGINVA